MNYLDLASKIAQSNFACAQEKSFLFGCVALRQDGAIVTSTNLRSISQNGFVHAESRALRKAGQGATLWVARINRLGNWAMAKPCSKCMSLLKNKKAKRIYYTIAPNEYGVISSF
jgi:tRNA(Arg) A34 adenosine deaminase TadA